MVTVRSRTGASAARGGVRRRVRVGLSAAALTLAFVAILVPLALAATPAFPDVPETHPYYEAVTDLASRGVISGYGSGLFGPADEVTRQQFAKMIVLAGGYPVSEDDVCTFADVPKGGSATFFPDNYIAVCAANSITTGKTATTFDPYSKITRYQVITMVVRTAESLHPGLLAAPPEEWPTTGIWAQNVTHGSNAARAEFNGLLAGLDLLALDPNGNMTRAEVAQVLHNLLNLFAAATTTTESTSATTEPPSTSTTTTDSTTTTTGCVP